MAERPPYVSDEDWAKHCLENGIDLNSDRVVPFERKRRRREPPPPPPGGWPSWNDKLRRENGRVIPDLANALIALREERELAFAMSFNEMLQRSIVDAEWPHAPRALPAAPPPHEVGDDDVSRLQEWLQHMGMPRVGRETVKQAVEVYARERRVHAIRDWLNNIEWDGVHRTPTWLRACLGCPDDEYQRQIGPMFLISMVARIFQPGCKCDYMIVLEGPQGEEKSKFCRALAGGDQYFSEHLPPIDGDPVRLAMHLRGPWLIEVAELASMLKSDPEATKHFVSRQIEKYTPKYGHGEVVEPRQCVLVGTTNEDDYIRDVTGGRRYWPVAVASVKSTPSTACANNSSPRPSRSTAKANPGGPTASSKRPSSPRSRTGANTRTPSPSGSTRSPSRWRRSPSPSSARGSATTTRVSTWPRRSASPEF
jgi:hypothetical protein